MNFIGISLFFSSLVGAKFYKIFTNRYAEYCENLTMNNENIYSHKKMDS